MSGAGGAEAPRLLDELQRVERKRMKLDDSGRKRWSLTDRPSHQEVLEDLGVGILDPDEDQGLENAASSHGSMLLSEPKRKSNLENVNPNVNSNSPRSRSSPRCSRSSAWSLCSSPASVRSRGSPHSSDRSGAEATVMDLERTLHAAPCELYEETPLPLLPLNAASKPAGSPDAASSIGSCDWSASVGSPPSMRTHHSRVQSSCSMYGPSSSANEDDRPEEALVRRHGGKAQADGDDAFSAVSDEVMLQVFKWLPKRALVECMLVCRRWHRVATDESLWQRLELGNRHLVRGALGRILARKPVTVRLASSEICHWTNAAECDSSRIQYLDLSMCVIDKDTLRTLLYCCPALKKLSLESVEVDERTCTVLGRCERLETLNLAMTTGLTHDGTISLLTGCPRLQSLNISWCQLGANTLNFVCDNLPGKLLRLNLAGSRQLNNAMVERLVARCPLLIELDLSDCSLLTSPALLAATGLNRLEHLAVSRCYSLSAQTLTRVSCMPSLLYLEVWGMLQGASLAALKTTLQGVSINQFMHSAIARPTVGTRRTSIWGLRTRD